MHVTYSCIRFQLHRRRQYAPETRYVTLRSYSWGDAAKGTSTAISEAIGFNLRHLLGP